MIHHPGQSGTKPGTQRDAITHQTSPPVGINQLWSTTAFWETCFGGNKSPGVTGERHPFLWQPLGLCLSLGKDGLKTEKRGGLNVARCTPLPPPSPSHQLPFEEEGTEVFPTSACGLFHPRSEKRLVTRASRHNGEQISARAEGRSCSGLKLVCSLVWVSDRRGSADAPAYPQWLHQR